MFSKRIVLLLGALVTTCIYLFSGVLKKDVRGGDVSCVQIPISFFPFNYKPLISIKIEGKKYSIMLDTGSSHLFDLHKKALNTIVDKKALEGGIYHDLKGGAYSILSYLIPDIQIHPHLHIHGAQIHEENIDFLNKDAFSQSFFKYLKRLVSLFFINGRIGSSFFKEFTCLFDMPHRVLFLAKDLDVLIEDGLFISSEYMRIPVLESRCGPVVSLETELGPRKFLLDTGSSHHLYNQDELNSSTSIFLSLQVRGSDLGREEFFSYPITSDLRNEFDGVLGIDFFKKHLICFDFPRKTAYLRCIVI